LPGLAEPPFPIFESALACQTNVIVVGKFEKMVYKNEICAGKQALIEQIDSINRFSHFRFVKEI